MTCSGWHFILGMISNSQTKDIVTWKKKKGKKKGNIENRWLLAWLKTTPSYMAGGCVCIVRQSVMVLACSRSVLSATPSFVQIYYPKWPYSLTGAHDVKMQVNLQQMSTLFYGCSLSTFSFICPEDICREWWKENRLPTSANGCW